MDDNNLKRVFSDYIAGKGSFGDSKEYLGMRASQRHTLFLEYFASLNASQQSDMASFLTTVATGHSIDFPDGLPGGLSLVFHLCVSGFASSFDRFKSKFEKEFNSEPNIAVWLLANDEHEAVDGREWKRTWRYALLLCNILKILESTEFMETAGILRSSAASEHFRSCLPNDIGG